MDNQFVTQNQLDVLRQEVHADFNRVNDSIARLVEQMIKASMTQEASIKRLEEVATKVSAYEQKLAIFSFFLKGWRGLFTFSSFFLLWGISGSSLIQFVRQYFSL